LAKAGDDVAPTFLNKGGGEVMVPVLVVVFHLDLKRHLDVQWWWYEQKGNGKPNVEMCQIRQGGEVPFWDGARNGISRGVQRCRKP